MGSKMETEYKQIMTQDGHSAESFTIRTRKGRANGLFSEGRIWVHLIEGNGCVKGIMDILTKKFKTNKITFTPLINDNVKNSIRGEIKICPADHPENPYGEDFPYLECEWNT